MKLHYFLPLALLSLSQCRSDKEAEGPPPPMPVQVAHPVIKTVALTNTYTGRFSPVEEVELQARVSGYLESVHFVEGQKVEKGDLMFKIDPRVFDAAISRAEAIQKQAVARLGLAKSSLARSKALVAQNAVSQEEFDTRESELAQAEADLLAAEAELRRVKLDREFADIHAPISGIAGRFNVTVGNYVTGGSAGSTLLTTIVPHNPIYCNFEVDERSVLQFTRLFFKGQSGGRSGERPEVEIAVSDDDNFEFKGSIDFSENQLDTETATLQMRARVENENEFLTPGLFARVRVPVGHPEELLMVKDASLGFDQDKRFAWVLTKDNSVERRYVETGPLEGDMRVISGGIDNDDLIAISGIQLLRPGAKVAPTTAPMVAE
ncbi:efflux RND transporter periplasmic adaptor subunit [Luteolibacter algae]|uniref:Efflux RND transporter periplasmic adaptor subunit n=1 Tax=Luteolibacter algae TaxID=454151 RepID=A0ABW5D699_9BACT